MRSISPRNAIACLIAASGLIACLAADGNRPEPEVRWRQHDIRRPRPAMVEPAEGPIASRPPKDAVILFDGTSLDGWKSHTGGPARWKVEGGVLETLPGAGMIETRAKYGDIQLHVEWAAPDPPTGWARTGGTAVSS